MDSEKDLHRNYTIFHGRITPKRPGDVAVSRLPSLRHCISLNRLIPLITTISTFPPHVFQVISQPDAAIIMYALIYFHTATEILPFHILIIRRFLAQGNFKMRIALLELNTIARFLSL